MERAQELEQLRRDIKFSSIEADDYRILVSVLGVDRLNKLEVLDNRRKKFLNRLAEIVADSRK